MTEEKAKTKWCPFARALGEREDGASGNYTANRGVAGKPDDWCLCIASDCMAWRRFSAADGYCGLAGNPDTP